MKIKRFKIEPCFYGSNFRVADRLKDGFVCIPLTHHTEEGLKEIMGDDMDVEVDTKNVHPEYLKEISE
jgi:hypothetical protein